LPFVTAILIIDAAGNLYGTTVNGGQEGDGRRCIVRIGAAAIPGSFSA
jgi:hypothetical protein